jgi:rubrerythrin
MTKSPIDVLRMALEREKDAVQYYKEYATTATEPAIREMFAFLVEEEVKHVQLLQAEVEKEVYQEN